MTFKLIYEHGIDKAPQLAPKYNHTIHEWLQAGYDPEKDIIPAIDYCTKNGSKDIGSWARFTGAIKAFHARRLREENTPEEVTLEESDKKRADKLRWIRDNGLHLSGVTSQDFEWLEAYEKQKSPTRVNEA